MEKQQGRTHRPHALLIPFPAQGHIGPFIHFAQSLLNHNIAVSLLNTDENHKRILENMDSSILSPIRFLSCSDGLSHNNKEVINLEQVVINLKQVVDTWTKNLPPAIDAIILQHNHEEQGDQPPVSVIISDVWFGFTQQIADKHGIPRVAFRTGGGCAFSLWHHTPLHHQGSQNGDDFCEKWRNKMANQVSVMEALRVEDLPKATMVSKETHVMSRVLHDHIQIAKEHGAFVLLNTWHDLEPAVLKDLDDDFYGKVLAIGPVGLIAEHDNGQDALSGNLWKEEEAVCLQWLDGHREKSVVYVSMGSLASLCEEDLIELGEGLEKSGYPFLWVVRDGGSSALEGLVKRCKERLCLVKWAPQKQVLKHPSVGAFLTHCGWNSVSEALSYGVPMVCLPFFGDQPCNRRFVSHVWKCGLELKDKVERDDVEGAVKRLMDAGSAEGIEIRSNAERIRQSAMDAVSHGGSSRLAIKRLVDFLSDSP